MLPRIVPQPAHLKLDKISSHSHITSKILSVVYILYSLEAGIFLLWLPWLSLWENNHMLYLYPQIQPLVANPFFKGAILGLGIDNILMGIWQVVHFKNAPRGFLSR